MDINILDKYELVVINLNWIWPCGDPIYLGALPSRFHKSVLFAINLLRPPTTSHPRWSEVCTSLLYTHRNSVVPCTGGEIECQIQFLECSNIIILSCLPLASMGMKPHMITRDGKMRGDHLLGQSHVICYFCRHGVEKDQKPHSHAMFDLLYMAWEWD